jgi:hypothetical protein
MKSAQRGGAFIALNTTHARQHRFRGAERFDFL